MKTHTEPETTKDVMPRNGKHTPGPWSREPDERFQHDQSAGVRAPDGTYVAAALDFNSYSRDAEVEANARLIATAPDLLAACQAAVGRCPMCMTGEECQDDLCYQLRAAIAKGSAAD